MICTIFKVYNFHDSEMFQLLFLFAEVEALQVELLVTLLDNTDGTAKQPASRTIFLRKFKRFINENLISSRVSTQCSTINTRKLFARDSSARCRTNQSAILQIRYEFCRHPCRSHYVAFIDFWLHSEFYGTLKLEQALSMCPAGDKALRYGYYQTHTLANGIDSLVT